MLASSHRIVSKMKRWCLGQMLSPCVSCLFLDGFEVPWLQFDSMFGCYLRESNGETLADPQACSLSFSLVGLPHSPCTISCFHPPFLNHFKVHQPTSQPSLCSLKIFEHLFYPISSSVLTPIVQTFWIPGESKTETKGYHKKKMGKWLTRLATELTGWHIVSGGWATGLLQSMTELWERP